MPGVIKFKTLNTGDVDPGGSAELEWTTDTNIKIHKMLALDRGEKALDNVQAFLKIGELVTTLDFIPASVLGADLEYCYKPEVGVSKGVRIYCKFVNSRADTVNIDWVTEYEEV